MEQLPTRKTEKVQVGESSSSSENESFHPLSTDKLKIGESPLENEEETDLEMMLPAINENEAEFDGSDLIAIPHSGNDLSAEALLRAKKYSKISDDQRRDFIDAVEVNGEKIINAAKRFNINYSSAKSILNVYKNEGRSIKKLTRNRGAKEDGSDQESKVGAESKMPSPYNPDHQKSPAVTFDACTQTQAQDESQGDNYLLALRDRLIASKTDKRENPYANSISHDFARHSGSLNDYTQLQMGTSASDNTFDMPAENKKSPEYGFGNPQNQFMQPSISAQGSSPGQYISTGSNQPQSYPQQQAQQTSLASESRGTYSQQQQYNNSSNQQQQQQQQNYMSPQDHKNQAQQLLIAQNNLDQQRLQSAAGFQNQLSNMGFSQPGANSDFSGMSYTGTGQSQYFSDSASESRNVMQSNQVQYLQPIMYLMPSNFSGMGGQNATFLPSGLQGLQSLQGMQGIQGLQGIQGMPGIQNLQSLGNLGNLGNMMSMPNNFMLYNGNNQGQGQNPGGSNGQSSQNQGQSGQSQNQGVQGQGQGQGQSQGQGQGQNQSQSQGQNQDQNQGQPQYQSQSYYQNQGPYFGSR